MENTSKLTVVKLCPIRNKQLTFGYVREFEIKCNNRFGELVKFMILIYFNLSLDNFKKEQLNSDECLKISLDGKFVNVRNASPFVSYKANVMLRNVVSTGIHEWIFRVCKSDIRNHDEIGIEQMSKFMQLQYSMNLNFGTCSQKVAGRISKKYPLILRSHGISNDWYSLYTFSQGDTIGVKLNCSNWRLYFKKNDNEYIKAFAIMPGQYSVKISFCTSRESAYELIKYQMTC